MAGAKCIPNVRLTLVHPIWHATITLPRVLGRPREIDFYRQWFSNDLYDDILLPSLNQHLAHLRLNSSQSNRGYRGRVGRDILEKWLLQHWIRHLLLKGRIHDHFAKAEEIADSLITKGRRVAISGSIGVDNVLFEKVLVFFNTKAPVLLKIGDTITIDETILQHFSKTAKDAGELCYMPKKPHPYGLKQFRAVTLLRSSHKRAIVSIIPWRPPTNFTPTQAALAILERVLPAAQANLHVVMDSAFCTRELVSALRRKEVTLSLSFKGGNMLDYAEVYNTAIEGLPLGETRRYMCDEWVIEVHHTKEKPTENHTGFESIISNAFQPDIKAPEPVKRILTYNTAATMWLENSEIEIALALSQPPGSDKRTLIRDKLRWDPIMPPPDAAGRQSITREGLEKMRKKQIVALHGALGCNAPSVGYKKVHYIDAVLEHAQVRPERISSAPRTRASATDVSTLRTSLGQVTDSSRQLIDFYNHHYGLVDATNEEIYRSIKLAEYKSYIKLRTFSILHALVVNAWAVFQEDVASRRRPSDAISTNLAAYSFKEFIFAVAQQILAE
jgi:hypothetical protein